MLKRSDLWVLLFIGLAMLAWLPHWRAERSP
jgi:hypothetical protein